MKKLKILSLGALVLALPLLLSGCDMALLNPKGMIAAEELRLIVIATLLMLVVVVPVIVLTVVIAWRYRASNTKATYAPNWDHSVLLEAIWWAVPCVIIVILATLTWITSHSLDPYKPLDSKVKPVTIEAVSMNWKWLFIYPEQNIATVNFLEVPVNTPINFRVTADSPMNSLWIPQLGGQIYAMPGMRTKLHLIAEQEGIYDGLGSNFTGDGFDGMKFKVKAVSSDVFNNWVASVKQSTPNSLSSTEYKRFAEPSSNDPVTYYSSVKPGLFQDIIMKYMMPSHDSNEQK